jgi:uncharacterized membrane protein YfcA
MIEHEAWTAIAVVIGGAVQAIVGLGFGLICAPFLTLTLGAHEGVRLSNLLGTLLNLLVLVREWRTARFRDAGILLVPSVMITPLAAWALNRTVPWALSVGTGVLVLVSLLAVISGVQFSRMKGTSGVLIAGSLSGAMNVIGGVGGPAVVSYAANARWPAADLRPTLAVYFLGLNAASVWVRGMPDVSPRFIVGAALALLGGVLLGMRIESKLDRHLVRRGTFLISALGALAAIAQGVLHE